MINMILTVTANSAIDKVLFIEEWVCSTTMRATNHTTSVGGKGLDSSVVLRHLGLETVGLCFLAGANGQELICLLERYGIKPVPVWVEGNTRVAFVIVENRHNRHSHVIAGKLLVNEEHAQKFFDRFSVLVEEADWVICAGSIPDSASPNMYKTLVEIAHQAGKPILIDSTGIYVQECLPAYPDILKMNWDEFEHTFNLESTDLQILQEKAFRIFRSLNAGALVITCGEMGILAFSSEGSFLATAPKQISVNAAGAGDAVSSALAWRFTLGDNWPDAMKWAAAVSAATVLTVGTADCDYQDVLRIYPQVNVEQLSLS